MPSRPSRATRRRLPGRAVLVVAMTLAAALLTTVAPGSARAVASIVPTEVTAAFPSTPADVVRVQAGTPRVITGRVRGSALGDRLVQVQSRGANGTWVTLAETRTRASGAYRVAAPTWWVARQTLRVYVPATATSTAAASTDVSTLQVTRATKARAGTAYALEFGPDARWNPCQTITYRLNTRLMPTGARADLEQAFAEVSAATGLRFTYVGTSTYLPFARNAKEHPTDADIVLAWATEHTVPVLAGSTAGRGGAAWAASGTVKELYDGEAVFDASQAMSPVASVQHRLTKQLYLHEIGHVIGLGHVSDRRQLMYPTMQRTADPHYGAGDLAGLVALGASRGCNSVGAR